MFLLPEWSLELHDLWKESLLKFRLWCKHIVCSFIAYKISLRVIPMECVCE